MRYLKIPKLTKQVIRRLWTHIDKRLVNACWPWLASKSSEGYGRFKIDGRLYSATRVVYYIVKGEDPAPKHVCHSCDNPCCNPLHLWRGTAGQNNDDSVRKGRYHRKESALRGEEAGGAKYTNKQIRCLRQLAQTISVPEAARIVGVNKWNAYRIVRGETWQHLPVLLHVNRTGQCRI